MDPSSSLPDPDTLPERELPQTGQSNEIVSEDKLMPCKCKFKARNLVVCIDGTSNQFGQKNTNVIELYRNLVKDDTQVTFYNSGIGTYARPSWRSFRYWKQVLDNKIDLAIAWNFESIVIDTYRWLSENYVKGDRIFLFGFSRGAYQVRALSAMIDKVGLIHKGNEGQIPFAYQLYADLQDEPASSVQTGSKGAKGKQKAQPSDMAHNFKTTFSRDVRVHFVGAWDTVSSVGFVRGKNLSGTIDGMKHVCFFRHALALDERRVKFLPEYACGGVFEKELDHQDPDHIKEVWFSGTHSDIGGGNVDNLNMDRGKPPLRWMSREAASAGLHLQGNDSRWDWETLGAVTETLTWVWWLFEGLPIKRLRYSASTGTTYLPHLGKGRRIHGGQKIHASVVFSSHMRARFSKENQIHSVQDVFKHLVWVEGDLSDMTKAIVFDLQGPIKDIDTVAERLGKIEAFDGVITALRGLPTTDLSWAWLNLSYAGKSEERIVMEALKQTAEIDEPTGTPRTSLPLAIISMAVSPDGSRIVAGSIDHKVRIWSAKTGVAVNGPLEGHTGPVSSVAFSHDKGLLASGSWDKTILFWTVGESPGRTLASPLKGHEATITCIAFSPNRECLVSGSYDMTVRVWDKAAAGEFISKVCIGHTGPVNAVSFSPDGRSIISGSWDRTVRVWDASTGDSILSIAGKHTGPVTSVVFSPNGKLIASGSGDETIRVWDSATGEDAGRQFLGHTTSSVTSIAFSPDGKYLVSGSLDRTVRVWEVDSGQAIDTPFTGHTGSITSVAFSSDGSDVISGSLDGSIKSWCAFPLQGHNKLVRSVAYSPDGKRVVSGSNDTTIRVWNAETGKAIGEPFRGNKGPVFSVAYSPDGKHIVSVSYDQTIRVWNTETGKAIGKPFRGHERPVMSVAYSPAGKHIVSASYDQTIRVWNMETGKAIGEPFRGHEGLVLAVAYSPDGKHVVSGSSDQTIRVWNAETGEAIGEPFRGHTNWVNSVAYSPDGKRIVSGSGDGTIRMWNAETGEAIGKPFRGHTDWVRSVAYTPDGRRIVSGSDDGTIRVWDAETGEAIGKPLEAHHGLFFSIAVSPDGKHVVSGGGSWGDKTGYVDIWDLDESDGHQPSSAVLRPRAFSPVWSIDTRSSDNGSA